MKSRRYAALGGTLQHKRVHGAFWKLITSTVARLVLYVNPTERFAAGMFYRAIWLMNSGLLPLIL